ncbi:MAG: response regulator, partial [Rhodocyclaceae bacterium]|nr:response regulator [Rhodocyclaceae bacterium]
MNNATTSQSGLCCSMLPQEMKGEIPLNTESVETTDSTEPSGRVLVVDDNNTCRNTHRAILAQQFDVITASSGAEALQICRERLPDLVLLDIGMPDMDGIEVCRQLREWAAVPIIFATGHESMEQHLKAYDAGGDDILIKPLKSEILLRKAALAILHQRKETRLIEEKNSLQRMAMSFLSTMGQSGALLNFMRASIACRSHRALAEKLLKTTSDLGIQCSLMVRHADGPTVLTTHGDPTEIEQAILEQSADMGRIFQFRSRLAVNYDRVSI